MEATHNGLPVGYGPGFQRSVTVENLASGGVIGTAAATVDVADVIRINQTTASKLISFPTPTDTTKARSIQVVANSSAALWTAYGKFIAAGSIGFFTYNPVSGWIADHAESPQTLYASGVAVALPADTNENNIALVTVPGGFLGLNSAVDTRWLIDNTSGTSNKTLKLKFGEMIPYNTGSLLAAATAHHGLAKSVFMLNSASVQMSTGIGSIGDGIASTGAPVSGTVDTTADVVVQLSVQKVTAADVTTLRYARVSYTHKG